MYLKHLRHLIKDNSYQHYQNLYIISELSYCLTWGTKAKERKKTKFSYYLPLIDESLK